MIHQGIFFLGCLLISGKFQKQAEGRAALGPFPHQPKEVAKGAETRTPHVQPLAACNCVCLEHNLQIRTAAVPFLKNLLSVPPSRHDFIFLITKGKISFCF